MSNSKIQMFKNYLNKWIESKNKKSKFFLKRKHKTKKYKFKRTRRMTKKWIINNSMNKILTFQKDLNKLIMVKSLHSSKVE